MYPFERFTERAKRLLTVAQEEAERSHHSYIGTEHLLIAVLMEEDGVAVTALNNLGVELDGVRSTIEAVLGRNQRIIIKQIIPTSRVKRVIELSFKEAQRRGTNHVGSEHLLVGLLLEGEGIAAHVLQDLGANLVAVRAEIERLSSGDAGSQRTVPAQSRRSVGSPDTGLVLEAIMDDPTSLSARVLAEFGVTADQLREVIARLRAEDATPGSGSV